MRSFIISSHRLNSVKRNPEQPVDPADHRSDQQEGDTSDEELLPTHRSSEHEVLPVQEARHYQFLQVPKAGDQELLPTREAGAILVHDCFLLTSSLVELAQGCTAMRNSTQLTSLRHDVST